jgi:hypothetical protein
MKLKGVLIASAAYMTLLGIHLGGASHQFRQRAVAIPARAARPDSRAHRMGA